MDGSITRNYGGSGLGLTISQELVAMMDGKIWVESEVGRGSTFAFTARFQMVQDEPAPAPAAMPDLAEMEVLVVDDNETNRTILREILASWGMRPVSADGGVAALAECERAAKEGHPFQLALLDAMMPGMDGFALARKIKGNPALSGAAVVMLSSMGLGGESLKYREAGIVAYLNKPVKQSELLNVILSVLADKGPSPAASQAPKEAERPAPPSAPRRRVLLAEDNAVNQRLITIMLEKQGHSVVMAANGAEALQKLGEAPFDIVLMDVQMPRMDGLQATAAIREEEKATGRHIPIVALTANAMKGDKDRCLRAGMDAYIAKPVKAQEVARAIEELCPRGSAPEEAAAHPPEEPLFDRGATLALVGDDPALAREIAALFLESSPALLEELRQAIEGGDAHTAERTAHALKGSASNFFAKRTVEAALALEQLAAGGGLAGADDGFRKLSAEIASLHSALKAFLDEEPP